MKKYLIVLLTLLSGCAVGPDYVPSEYHVFDTWTSQEDLLQTAVDDAEVITEWWTLLGDCRLDKYICMAANYNNDLLTAEASILQAGAIKMTAASALYPQIITDLNASRTYFSKNGPIFAGNSSTQGTSPITGLPFQVQTPQMQSLFNALIEANWQIDLFGKTQRSIESAEASLCASIEQRNDLLLSILAETAENYIQIRFNQQRGILTEEYISLLSKEVELAKKRLSAGYSNRLDLVRIEAELSSTQATLPPILANILKGIYALSVLTGNTPETLTCELFEEKPLPELPDHVGVGLRSDLLRRRPDVRYAERVFAGSVANIGVAIASFYPSFSLGADLGLQSLQIRNLFTPESKTWSYGADLNMPIFQGGLLIGNLYLSEAQAAAAGYQYQQAILNALQNTESALIAYNQDLLTLDLQQKAVLKNKQAAGLAEERFRKGLTNVTDLLDTERQANSAEQNFLQAKYTALVDLIALYKALGGGWETCFDCCE